jgi:hypothetical protein
LLVISYIIENNIGDSGISKIVDALKLNTLLTNFNLTGKCAVY